MNRYEFYYNKSGEFNCLYSNDYADRKYKNEDAIRRLKRIGKQSFHSVKIKERTQNKKRFGSEKRRLGKKKWVVS